MYMNCRIKIQLNHCIIIFWVWILNIANHHVNSTNQCLTLAAAFTAMRLYVLGIMSVKSKESPPVEIFEFSLDRFFIPAFWNTFQNQVLLRQNIASASPSRIFPEV